MKLNKLIRRLKENICSFASLSNAEEDIFNCRLLIPNELLHTNTIYICTPKTLTKKLDSFGYTFLCLITSNSEQLEYHFHNSNLIYMEISSFMGKSSYMKKSSYMDQVMDEVMEKVIVSITEDTILANNMYQLIQVLHANKGLQALIDTAYTILGNPLLLVDSSYKLLACCQNFIFNRPDLEAQKELGYIIESNIEAMKKAKLYEKARESKYPYYDKAADAAEGWITALVYIHGIESAHIAVSDANHPFTDNDFELIDFLCRLVSLELQKSDFYRTNESMMQSFFLSELLDNNIRDLKTIQHRAQSLKWKLTEYLRIITISENNNTIFDKKAQLISKQTHKLLPNSHWVIHDGHIVFLLCTKDPSIETFLEEQNLLEFLEINQLTASVSRSFHNLIDVSKYYKESNAAYQLGQRFHPEKNLYFYSDYICQHIGGILSESYALSNFYHPGIVKMKEYDSLHHTNLLLTLKEYLTYPENPTFVAEQLFIHKNTLFYRMKKIKELFTLDITNGEERLKIHLTLKFMELEP